MIDQEDLKWLTANAAELNGLLQQAARQAEQARLNKAQGEHLVSLSEQLERASRSSQAISDRITGRVLRGTGSEISARAAGQEGGPKAASNGVTKMPVGEIAFAEETGDSPRIRNPRGARELILLVDDDADLLERTGEILDFEDYRFITAKDGIEALKIYQRLGKEIALVLLDYFLPVINGDAVFDELKAISPDVRVVLSSGFGEQAQISDMLARGLCAFIPKPYSHKKLIEQIRLVLDA